MKKRHLIELFVVVLFGIYYYTVTIGKKHCVERNWLYYGGYYVGDYIDSGRFHFSKDTMVFLHQKCLFKFQVYDFLVIQDIETGKYGVYDIMQVNKW